MEGKKRGEIMQLIMFEWEVQEALTDYLQKQYGMKVDIEETSIEYQELERVFKKHKNGKIIKSEHGGSEIDWENSSYVTKHINFNDTAEMHLFVEQRSTDNE
jgi:hypothetical protein|tara:strand:- start:213 stop:518 length:306 start_codon:yes stop_codon:yes gene_type:complete